MADKLIRKIKAVSVKQKNEGKIGFLVEKGADWEESWYNVLAEESVLDTLLKEIISKGNLIEFETENGIHKNFTLKEKSKESKFSDDMVNIEDLLDKAHEKFKDNFSIKTEMISVDWEKKNALVKAKVIVYANEEQVKKFQIGDRSEESRISKRMIIAEFDGYGDATQDNCGELVKKSWIRMAETRAISRALRWATNIAKTAEEEKS